MKRAKRPSFAKGYGRAKQEKSSKGLPSTTFLREKSGAGFTIIEVIIYSAALMVLVGTVTLLLLWMMRANNQVFVRNEVVSSVEHALSQMSGEIREAQSVYTPTTIASPPQLSLQTRNNVPAGETSTYIDFFLCGTRLCVKRESQAPFALTSEKIEIQNLTFTQVQTGSAPSIHIVIEASYVNPTNRLEFQASQQLQTTVSLRAYE